MTSIEPQTERDPALVARAMNRCIPALVARSTVALVASMGGNIRQIGSGTLVALADERFVVTAAHVVRHASTMDATLGVSGARDGRFVAAAGTWLLSGALGSGGVDDHDVAIYQLDPDQGDRFDTAAFVRLADVSFSFNAMSACLVVSGFPGMWSTSLSSHELTMRSKLLQYATFAYEGNRAGLAGFDPDRHLLLDATPTGLLDGDGEPTAFRTRTGYPADMPHDLVGVSGCSVWMIGDFTRPIDEWSASEAKLVGVETSVYKGRRAIRATRWSSVASILYAAVPDVRKVLEMYERMMR